MNPTAKNLYRCPGCKGYAIAEAAPDKCPHCGMREHGFAGPMTFVRVNEPGRLLQKPEAKMSGYMVDVRWCPDCDTDFTSKAGSGFTINGHKNDGFCPWCRTDSKPWTRGRGL